MSRPAIKCLLYPLLVHVDFTFILPILIPCLFNSKVEPKFKEPYDSREIGLITASNPSVKASDRGWPTDEVISKCLIIPDAPEFEDPLPENILKSSDPRAAFHDHFSSEMPTWSIFSLLLPPENLFA